MENQIQLRLFSHNRTNCPMPLDDQISYYDLTIVLSGSLHYRIAGRPVSLQSGDGILIPAGSHRIRLPGTEETHYYSINFFASACQIPDLPLYLPDCAGVILKDLLIVMDKLKQEGPGNTLEERQTLLLQTILLTLAQTIEQRSRNPHVNRILQFIHTHYTQPITLADVASNVHLSVPHCCSLVKTELHTTIYTLIMTERLLLAQEYILRGELPLQQIPEKCGFRDYNHFSKSFHRFTGVVPSRYGK